MFGRVSGGGVRTSHQALECGGTFQEDHHGQKSEEGESSDQEEDRKKGSAGTAQDDPIGRQEADDGEKVGKKIDGKKIDGEEVDGQKVGEEVGQKVDTEINPQVACQAGKTKGKIGCHGTARREAKSIPQGRGQAGRSTGCKTRCEARDSGSRGSGPEARSTCAASHNGAVQAGSPGSARCPGTEHARGHAFIGDAVERSEPQCRSAAAVAVSDVCTDRWLPQRGRQQVNEMTDVGRPSLLDRGRYRASTRRVLRELEALRRRKARSAASPRRIQRSTRSTREDDQQTEGMVRSCRSMPSAFGRARVSA